MIIRIKANSQEEVSNILNKLDAIVESNAIVRDITMFYTHYRGQTCGRILGYVEVCCGLSLAEQVTVEVDKISYNGETLGKYHWMNDSDMAEIDFYQFPHRVHYIQKAWLIDKPELMYNIDYALQEMSRYIRYQLAGETIIKQRLKEWLFLATEKDIEEIYPTLVEKCQWLNKYYYESMVHA